MAQKMGVNHYLDAVRAVTGVSTEKKTGAPQNAGEAITQRIQNDPTNQKRAQVYAERENGLQLGQWQPDPERPGTTGNSRGNRIRQKRRRSCRIWKSRTRPGGPSGTGRTMSGRRAKQGRDRKKRQSRRLQTGPAETN